MAKVSVTKEHDWLQVRLTFPDGTKAKVHWNRGGVSTEVTPYDAAIVESFSTVVMQAKAKKSPGYRFDTPGAVTEEIARVGRQASSMAGFVDEMKRSFGVSGQLTLNTQTAPEETVTTIRKGRGWVVTAAFPSGEKAELSINGKSVGAKMTPLIDAKFRQMSKFVFAMKAAFGDEETATKVKAAADNATDFNGWIEGLQASLAPSTGPKR